MELNPNLDQKDHILGMVGDGLIESSHFEKLLHSRKIFRSLDNFSTVKPINFKRFPGDSKFEFIERNIPCSLVSIDEARELPG